MVSTASTPALHAQSAGASVAVRMIDGIDSSKDPAGKQYRASVTKAVDAGNGVMISQGANATVTLANSNGSGWVTQLVSVTVNGQALVVTSGSASVTAAAQSAAGAAMGSVNSVLGGFGRHVNTPAAVTAIATGQRVVVPPGTTLSFALSQPPSVNTAMQTAPASPNVAVASAPQPAQAYPAPVATAGQHWYVCRYQIAKNPAQPAMGSLMYYAVLPAGGPNPNGPNGLGWHFSAYVQQNYTAMERYNPGNAFCKRIADDQAGRANSMDLFLKEWSSSNMLPVQVPWSNTAAENAAIDAKLARGSQPQTVPVQNSKECAYHATCSH